MDKKWTYETITKLIEEHPEINSRSSLEKISQSAYKAALKMGIVDDLFGKPVKERYVWSKEKVINYVKQHPEIDSKIKLKNSNESAYNAAYRFHIMDELFESVKQVQSELFENDKQVWNKENIIDFIKNNNITYRRQLYNMSSSCYYYAYKMGILDDIFGKIDEKFIGYCVYIYKIQETHTIYVGLTHSPQTRDMQHLTPNKHGKYDSLGEYCKNNNIPIPKMEIIKNMLTATEASNLEKEIWYEYKNKGWNIINSEKTLGFLGPAKRRQVWSRTKIRIYLQNHPEIKTEEDMKIYNPNAYEFATKNNFLTVLFENINCKNITENDIKIFLEEHPEIKTKSALQRTSGLIYKAAKYLEIIDDLFPRKVKWTEESIVKYLQEHPDIKTRGEFAKSNSAAYMKALRLKIMDKLLVPKFKWTEENIVMFLKEHPEINSRYEFAKSNASAYVKAQELKIMNKLFPQTMHKKKEKWTEENIVMFLKEHPEINSRSDFEKINGSAYAKARKLKIIDRLFPHKRKEKWTEESIIQFLEEHPEINSRSDFEKSNGSAYLKALKLKIIDKLFPLKFKWTEESIIQFLKEHPEIKTRGEFAKSNSAAYMKALRLKIIDKLFS